MTKSHHQYRTFVTPTVEGEVIERPTMPSAIVPMQSAELMQNGQQRLTRQVEKLTGTPLDRAHAFTVRTRSISMMTGGATAALWFLIRWALPLTTGASTAGVLVVGAVSIVSGLVAFFVVWSVAYAIDMMTSPGGVDLFESWRTQRRIDRQSDAMVEAFRKQNGIEGKR